jgi:hypothetical protein
LFSAILTYFLIAAALASEAPASALSSPFPSPLSLALPALPSAPGASDTHAGTLAAPWATIQHAVDSVGPGDTILVLSGLYAGARLETSGTANAGITLKAAPGAAVTINQPGPNNKHRSNLEIETWEWSRAVSAPTMATA